MDLELFKQIFTEENIKDWLEQYRALGPFPGIFLPFLEAFLPFLPLFIFVAGNALVYGLWFGFFYSWLGACLGAFAVFFVMRRFARKRLIHFITRHQKIRSTMNWFEKRGFGAVFLLYCFPFTPSSIVNVVAGLSRMNVITFTIAVLLGKMVMIFIVSFIGHDLFDLFRDPLQLIIVSIMTAVLWVGGKFLEAKLKQKAEKERQ